MTGGDAFKLVTRSGDRAAAAAALRAESPAPHAHLHRPLWPSRLRPSRVPASAGSAPAAPLPAHRGNQTPSGAPAGSEPSWVRPSAAPARSVQDVLRAPGQPLAAPVKTEMEVRLGANFSDVRLHTDAVARASAAAVGARAYTSGSHVVIGDAAADKHTLAHELTHVIQQRQGLVTGTGYGDGLTISDPGDRYEREAAANAVRAMSAGTNQHRDATPTGSPSSRQNTVQPAASPAHTVVQRIPWLAILTSRPAKFVADIILEWGYDQVKELVAGLGDEARTLSDELLEQAIAKAAEAKAALRPAAEPFRPVSEHTKTAQEARQLGLSSAELLARRRQESDDAELGAFSASLVGKARSELSVLKRQLQLSGERLAKRKLEAVQKSEIIRAAVLADDFDAYRNELEKKALEKGSQLTELTSSAQEVKSFFQGLVGSNRPKVREATIETAKEVYQEYADRYNFLLTASRREIKILHIILTKVQGPAARDIATVSVGDLDAIASYLEEQIAAAESFSYDTEHLEQMLSRVRREPDARRMLAYIIKKGVAGLLGAKQLAAEQLEEAVSVLQALEPWKVASFLINKGLVAEDPEVVENRAEYEAKVKESQELYADLDRLSQLYVNADYGDRIESIINVQNWYRRNAIALQVAEEEEAESAAIPSVPLEQLLGEAERSGGED